MLKALCWKETTCCKTYSRIVMLWSISQTRSNTFKARCAKKVHSDNVLYEKLHVEGTLQGKDDVFSHVARKNDKLIDVFLEKRAFFGRFRSQETVWSQRVTVEIACCRCLTGEKWYIEGALCHVVGCFLDKKRRVQDMLRYKVVCWRRLACKKQHVEGASLETGFVLRECHERK